MKFRHMFGLLSAAAMSLALTGGAKARLAALTPEGFSARIDLSITDEWPLAQAFVVISLVPRGTPDAVNLD